MEPGTRQRSILFFVVGFSLSGAGAATGSHVLTFVGMGVIAVTLRSRKQPPLWNYLVFIGVLVAMAALVPLRSPLMGAIPLMLSYVFDFIDAARQARLAQSAGISGARATPVEPPPPLNAGPAGPPVGPAATKGVPPVS